MRKVILLAAAGMMLATTAWAGEKVPANVKAKFHKLYPQVKKASWDKEGANYEAEFHLNKKEMSVTIDAKANLLETETEIPVSALPKKARDYAAKHGKKIREASKIVNAENLVNYEAEARGGDMIFDAHGNFIKTEKGD